MSKNPCKTALYRMFDAHGTLQYVGVTKGILMRLQCHGTRSGWFHETASIEMEWFENLGAALLAEEHAIRTEFPRFNIQHLPSAHITWRAKSGEAVRARALQTARRRAAAE